MFVDYEFVGKLPDVAAPTDEYSEEDLYLLALLFTLVKILFVKATMGVIKPLVALLGRHVCLLYMANSTTYVKHLFYEHLYILRCFVGVAHFEVHYRCVTF